MPHRSAIACPLSPSLLSRDRIDLGRAGSFLDCHDSRRAIAGPEPDCRRQVSFGTGNPRFALGVALLVGGGGDRVAGKRHCAGGKTRRAAPQSDFSLTQSGFSLTRSDFSPAQSGFSMTRSDFSPARSDLYLTQGDLSPL